MAKFQTQTTFEIPKSQQYSPSFVQSDFHFLENLNTSYLVFDFGSDIEASDGDLKKIKQYFILLLGDKQKYRSWLESETNISN